MSHLGPSAKRPRHRRADCRKGRHEYGESQNVGAGILRRVCRVCAAVSIDLTKADELTKPVLPNPHSILSLAAQQAEGRRGP